MKRKRNKDTNKKSKSQLRKEILTMRKKLGASGQQLAGMSLEQLKVEASFMQRIMIIEQDQGPTIAQKLIELGIELPDPKNLKADQVSDKLWQVIEGLADLGHYLSMTNHLSDRELYQFFWSDLLNEKTFDMGEGLGTLGQLHEVMDTLSLDYYKYYADDFDQLHFKENFPDEELPAQEKLASNRDSKLPTLFTDAA